jgi:hypothetical protein
MKKDKFINGKRQLGIPGMPKLLVHNLNAYTTINHHNTNHHELESTSTRQSLAWKEVVS